MMQSNISEMLLRILFFLELLLVVLGDELDTFSAEIEDIDDTDVEEIEDIKNMEEKYDETTLRPPWHHAVEIHRCHDIDHDHSPPLTRRRLRHKSELEQYMENLRAKYAMSNWYQRQGNRTAGMGNNPGNNTGNNTTNHTKPSKPTEDAQDFGMPKECELYLPNKNKRIPPQLYPCGAVCQEQFLSKCPITNDSEIFNKHLERYNRLNVNKTSILFCRDKTIELKPGYTIYLVHYVKPVTKTIKCPCVCPPCVTTLITTWWWKANYNYTVCNHNFTKEKLAPTLPPKETSIENVPVEGFENYTKKEHGLRELRTKRYTVTKYFHVLELNKYRLALKKWAIDKMEYDHKLIVHKKLMDQYMKDMRHYYKLMAERQYLMKEMAEKKAQLLHDMKEYNTKHKTNRYKDTVNWVPDFVVPTGQAYQLPPNV